MSKQRSVKNVLLNIYEILRKDETLMRLLYYPPKGSGNLKSPLDPTLPNLVDENSDVYWDLVDERILLQPKLNDIELKPLARIYVVQGNSRKDLVNLTLTIQEIDVHIYTHDLYEKDLRNADIHDRVSDLLLGRDFGFVGKLMYEDGRPVPSPKEYTAVKHSYYSHIPLKRGR